FEDVEIKSILAAEIMIDKVLARADALGYAVDASAIEPAGGEFILRRAQDELLAQRGIAPVAAALPPPPQLCRRRSPGTIGQPDGLVGSGRRHQPTFAGERTAALPGRVSVTSKPWCSSAKARVILPSAISSRTSAGSRSSGSPWPPPPACSCVM